MEQLKFHKIVLGCDPEFFFNKEGQVVGAEKVLPTEGLSTLYGGKVVIDGVQGELNPAASHCRQVLAAGLSECFMAIEEALKGGKVGVSFARAEKVSRKEMDSLTAKSKTFGCKPTTNFSGGKVQKSFVKVNPLKYRIRSAGGHIHLGIPDTRNPDVVRALKSPELIMPILDLIVGNTCVLIDRDERNIERRKEYGKAGEFRMPEYGIEYRPLSNFWLQSYQLMSMATGLARQAAIIVANDEAGEIASALFAKVDINEVQKAINTNDFELAMHNFKAIEDVLLLITPTIDDYPLHAGVIEEFHHFVKRGSDYWFKEDPMTHWTGLRPSLVNGFESFLQKEVREDMAK